MKKTTDKHLRKRLGDEIFNFLIELYELLHDVMDKYDLLMPKKSDPRFAVLKK